TWTAMALFGRAVWLSRGDPFGAAFGVLARFAPTEVRVTDPAACHRCARPCAGSDGVCLDCGDCFDRAAPAARRFSLRRSAAGLSRPGDVTPSLVVFVLLLLSTVTFDGFTATPAWSRLEGGLYARLTPLGDLRLSLIDTAGLLAFPILFFLVYWG